MESQDHNILQVMRKFGKTKQTEVILYDRSRQQKLNKR